MYPCITREACLLHVGMAANSIEAASWFAEMGFYPFYQCTVHVVSFVPGAHNDVRSDIIMGLYSYTYTVTFFLA